MKSAILLTLATFFAAVTASANLYYIPTDNQESLPLRWSVGLSAIWDDNTTPAAGNNDETVAMNATISATYAEATPQTNWDIFALLGKIYYLNEPVAAGAEDTNSQARLGFNLSHTYSERLRFDSRNFLSYELEPDYARGFATNRQVQEYFFWSSDQSFGYRWTERFATVTGIIFDGLTFDDLPNNDRISWTLYNQFRYQISPVTVLTSSHRHSITDANDLASDSLNHFFLVGIEHRFSPNTIVIVDSGIQVNDPDLGSVQTVPYLELSLLSQRTDQLVVRSFARFGIEVFDTVQDLLGPVEYNNRPTLRFGTTASFQYNPYITFFGGIDGIITSFEDGRRIPSGLSAPNRNEILFNISIGASMNFTEYLSGNITFNHTLSESDFVARDYERNRISIGLRTEF